MPTLLLANPHGGRGRVRRELEELRRLASRHGLSLVVPERAEDLTALARLAAEEGAERLLVAGGDGTAHWAVQGLAGSETALAILPLGTGNDLARELGMSAAPEEAVRVALERPTRSIDLLRVGERWVSGVISVGFDAAVAARAERIRWAPSVSWLYALATLLTWPGFRAPELQLEIDGETRSQRLLLLAVANASRYGGGLRIAPDAVLDDGVAEAVLVRPISFFTMLRLFTRLRHGDHIGHPAVEIQHVDRLEIAAPAAACELWGDGECVATLGPDPLEIRIVPQALRVVGQAPSANAR